MEIVTVLHIKILNALLKVKGREMDKKWLITIIVMIILGVLPFLFKRKRSQSQSQEQKILGGEGTQKQSQKQQEK